MSAAITLTGDLHHQSLGTGNQRHCELSELQTAQRFLRLLEERSIKITFFVSGKCFTEDWDELEPITESPLVELGGHGFNCFTPQLFHRAANRVLGSYNGPAWYQKLDATRTIEAARRRTGRRIRVWRNHMYMHGPHTERVLAECDIEVVSDGTAKEAVGPVLHREGIYNWPLNVIPDHEHLYHAERTEEWVAAWLKRYDWSDDWGPFSYSIDDWVELALGDIRRNEERGAISNLIIHPITMYLCDRFSGVTRILDYIADRPSMHMTEVVAMKHRGEL